MLRLKIALRKIALRNIMFLLLAAALCAAPLPARAQSFAEGLHAFNAAQYGKAFGNWWPLAVRGHAKAQAALGFMYYAGKGVKQDDQKSMLWFSKAAEKGQPTAQFFMGLHFYYGRGVKKDLARAHAWCDIAMSNGYMNSLFCRDTIELEMTSAEKRRSDELQTEFHRTHKFTN